MFEDRSGRLVRSQTDAESYIWSFMAENMAQTDVHIVDHTHDFDLFLPWLLEIVSNMHVSPAEDPMPIFDIERIYMDAAWEIVMQGYLRPGPRVITGDIRDGYGKGFSLTVKGLAKLKTIPLPDAGQQNFGVGSRN